MTEQLSPNQGEPPPAASTEALAVRPLLEQVARMGDCIGANTVGKITAISQRAAAWLAENPPGQPVAIEPRGCPIPGACSCVEPALPAPAPNDSTFHLQPGDACRLLDGPLMVYFGLQEHDDKLQHAFGYWGSSSVFTEIGPIFVTTGYEQHVLKHIKKVESDISAVLF